MVSYSLTAAFVCVGGLCWECVGCWQIFQGAKVGEALRFVTNLFADCSLAIF
jgi:hypothetical protein